MCTQLPTYYTFKLLSCAMRKCPAKSTFFIAERREGGGLDSSLFLKKANEIESAFNICKKKREISEEDF